MCNTSKIKNHTVSVRALVDFCLTEGDLVSQYRPGPSAFEGQFAHTSVQKKRSGNYQSEVPLSLTWLTNSFDLTISGRADCIFDFGVEEIKSTRLPAREIPENLTHAHHLQAKVYAAMVCLLNHWHEATVRLTYVHPQTLDEWSEETIYTSENLLDLLASLCARYDSWLQSLEKHWQKRRVFLTNLAFPYQNMRPAQRQMAETVYKACRTGRHATIEAPTGTGKTLASLFPALKAFNDVDNRSLYFLTMKTTGKIAAREALQKLDPQYQLATVFLSARSQLCLNSESVCDGAFCIYAKDYYAKRTQLRKSLLKQQHWHTDALRAFGEEYQICPYYLSQDWAIWSDVIVGDLNYIYDTTAVQPYLLKEINNQATLLIDEGHNLIDRGRMIFSTEFTANRLQTLLKKTPKSIQKSLRKIQTKLRDSCKDQQGMLTDNPPSALLTVLREFVAQAPQILRENPDYEPDIEWQEFIFSCSRFNRLNELANTEDFVWRYQDGTPGRRSIDIICLNPSTLLAAKHDLVNNVIAFSATFKPWQYSNQLNGLPSAVVQTLPSPFSSSQFEVYIATDISTRYQHRFQLPDKLQSSLRQVIESSRNSMVFFSSYAQLRACTETLLMNNRVLIQTNDWSKETREEVLKRFRLEHGLTLMTVLGGAFSEGIDLPGTSLEQVVIIGPGLPQMNEINNAIRQRMDSLQWPGFDFAYVFPGLQKVLQAAGRCVRTEQDKGQILLIDDRFEQYRRQGWLPSIWSVQSGPLALWQSM